MYGLCRVHPAQSIDKAMLESGRLGMTPKNTKLAAVDSLRAMRRASARIATARSRLYDKPNFPLRSLIATLAINLMGGQGLLWLFTPRVKALPKIFGVGSIHIGPATASYDKIGAIVCSAILLLLTLGWMKGSRRGLEIRAMMQNPEGAALVGVGLRSTAMAVMMVTGAMAGLASVLLSQTYFISPFAGTTPLVKGMVVALAGGLGSVAGGFVASLRCKSRATEPMLSRDVNWVLQLKFSRTWRPWAVWSVGFCGVRFAIYGPRQARGTAKPECFAMFRVADRPATDTGSKLHKFNLN